MMQHIRHIHLIGIGGNGMSGIAKILVSEGYKITGSDLLSNFMTEQLVDLGIKIYFGHHSKNVHGADIIVISSAISYSNPEVMEAKRLNIPVIKRAKMLEKLMCTRFGIAISGTHGKTTVAAIITHAYIMAKLDPTFVIGGILTSVRSNARLGSGKYLIVEADESDASFLCLRPMIAVVTNIEAEHMETYKGSIENLKRTFINFLHNLSSSHGCAVMCIDDPIIQEILPKINRRIITYGFNEKADLHIFDYHQNYKRIIFRIFYKRRFLFLIRSSILLGKHNILNITAALAVILENEYIDKSKIFQIIEKFPGIDRRFNNLGYYSLVNINGKNGKILLIDDYGHHPSEISSNIITIREIWSDKRLFMVFQPHRYTRTRDLYGDFIKVLSDVDVLLILDIYPAGEESIYGVNSQSLCQDICIYGKINPIFVLDEHSLLNVLKKYLEDGDLLLMQGAGTIGNITKKLTKNGFVI